MIALLRCCTDAHASTSHPKPNDSPASPCIPWPLRHVIRHSEYQAVSSLLPSRHLSHHLRHFLFPFPRSLPIDPSANAPGVGQVGPQHAPSQSTDAMSYRSTLMQP